MKNIREIITKRAIDAIKPWKRGTLAISMGVGKTKIALEHMQLVYDKFIKENKNLKILVIVPRLKIIDSWKDEIKKWNFEHLESYIEYTTYRSLPKKENNYDAIYADEIHSLVYKSHDKYLSQHKGFFIGLTGTPPENPKSKKYKMLIRHCPIRFEYDIDDAIKDGIINNYRITIHLLNLDKKENFTVKIKKNKKVVKSWKTSEQKCYEYWENRVLTADYFGEKKKLSLMLMKNMQKFDSKINYTKKIINKNKEKILTFVSEKNQADNLSTYTYYSGNKESENNLKLFKENKINNLIAIDQISEGVTIPKLKSIIITHSYSNSRKTKQKIGRALRLNPKETSNIHILCYKNTVDEDWVKNALKSLDQSKIKYIEIDN